ncbi:MAG: hypothetical protein ACK4K7_03120 [Allosphingosinicella sp.]|uniref:hypothetical protein n=1 Tax=Allosphingosinicella sp. TaxID=2823234 RepID=UPI00395EA05E
MARRPQVHLCVTGCGRRTRGRWQFLCGACWALLPAGRRREIREADGPHNRSRAAMAGAAWLKTNNPAAVAARITGERE